VAVLVAMAVVVACRVVVTVTGDGLGPRVLPRRNEIAAAPKVQPRNERNSRLLMFSGVSVPPNQICT